MARSTFELDVRGMVGAEEQLALLELPPQLRRRLLNNVTKRVRSMSRQRIRDQKNLDGTAFAARKKLFLLRESADATETACRDLLHPARTCRALCGALVS